MFGVPESIKYDNGQPNFAGEQKSFSMENGFSSRPVTPAHPEGNSLAERFIGVLVTAIKTAEAENMDPSTEIKRDW